MSDTVLLFGHDHKVAAYPESGEFREFSEQIVSYVIGARDNFAEIITKKMIGGES